MKSSPLEVLQRIFEFAYDCKFSFGDVIRNKDPYLDEPSYRIVNIDQYGYVCTISPDFSDFMKANITFDGAENYEKLF